MITTFELEVLHAYHAFELKTVRPTNGFSAVLDERE